jgi:hypothetical protein
MNRVNDSQTVAYPAGVASPSSPPLPPLPYWAWGCVVASKAPFTINPQQASALGLRIRRLGGMSPEQVGRFLGYNVPRYNKNSYFFSSVDDAMTAWLPALCLERVSEPGYMGVLQITYRVPVAARRQVPSAATPVRTYRDPRIATWTKKQAQQQLQERRAAWGGVA